MKKIVASLLTLFAATACATNPSQDRPVRITSQVTPATEVARRQLATELGVDATKVEVLTTEAQTWPDSSLGCGKPGSMAMQVITSGHAFVFDTPQGDYRVHATDKYAVVCRPATKWRDDRPSPAQMKRLNEKIETARIDLANRLNVRPTLIRTPRFVAAEWADSSMECEVANETTRAVPTKGYRIALSYQGRVYTYHTDLERVRACPAIESM